MSEVQREFLPVDQQIEILQRGASDIVSLNELEERLEKSRQEGRPLTVKWGADPSAPDIHLGHTVQLRKLRQFQDLGHKVIFLIGDFTGMIGDPSGRSKTREPLTREQVEHNADTYRKQVAKILLMDSAVFQVVYNSSWLSKMSFADVLKLSGRYTVARMLERDDFAKRYSEGIPISVCEFLYPLMQGYDSVALECDVELGGTDQTFNLLVGRHLQNQFGQIPQVVMTLPLLVGTDGVNKMSKSLNNYAGVTEPAGQIYGKIMSIPDAYPEHPDGGPYALILDYYLLCTDIELDHLEHLKNDLESGRLHPKKVKSDLAHRLAAMYTSEAEAQNAAAEFERVFAKHQIPEDMPVLSLSSDDLKDGKIWVVTLMQKAGFVSSSSEGRRLAKQGAVRIDGERVAGAQTDITVSDGAILQVGKRRFARLKLQD